MGFLAGQSKQTWGEGVRSLCPEAQDHGRAGHPPATASLPQPPPPAPNCRPQGVWAQARACPLLRLSRGDPRRPPTLFSGLARSRLNRVSLSSAMALVGPAGRSWGGCPGMVPSAGGAAGADRLAGGSTGPAPNQAAAVGGPRAPGDACAASPHRCCRTPCTTGPQPKSPSPHSLQLVCPQNRVGTLPPDRTLSGIKRPGQS